MRHLRRVARGVLAAGLERSPLRGLLFWRLPTPARAVALTFDDGPDPEQTPRILDILAARGARATFFVVGEAARRYPEIVRRIAAEGHALGNHTQTHVRCPPLSAGALRGEIEAADGAIRDAAGDGCLPAFRPPWGQIAPAQAWRLARGGRRIVMWSQDSRDYRSAGAAEIAALGDRLRERDIVLLHDRFPATVAALPLLLETLARRELRAVSLDDPEVRRECRTPGP